MKILVIVKRVEDPEIKIKLKADGSGIETEQMKYVVCPFHEIAVEEALRVRDASGGENEVVALCVGPEDATQQLRTALAMGADRAIHVVAATSALDPTLEAIACEKVIREESPEIVILGKQAIDDDLGVLGGMLAERLGMSQGTFASKEISLDSDEEKSKIPALKIEGGRLTVVREVDGGIETLSLSLPALVTTELRLNMPRYASLPGIMKAKKKEIRTIQLSDAIGDATMQLKVIKLEAPPKRQAGMIVPDVATLVSKLRNEAKVI